MPLRKRRRRNRSRRGFECVSCGGIRNIAKAADFRNAAFVLRRVRWDRNGYTEYKCTGTAPAKWEARHESFFSASRRSAHLAALCAADRGGLSPEQGKPDADECAGGACDWAGQRDSGRAVRGGAFFCGGSVTFCRGRDPAALSGGFGGRSDPLPSARKPSLHALFRTGVRRRNGLQSVLPALGRQLLHRWISGALRPAGKRSVHRRAAGDHGLFCAEAQRNVRLGEAGRGGGVRR